MYSPRELYIFMTGGDFRSILGKSFYKRHMESSDIKSPFDTPEEIYMLEYLISSGYVIAEYRNDAHNDSESYLISTMGHAFVENYKQSWKFRLRSHIHYFKRIHWIIFASMIGSLIASMLWALLLEYHFLSIQQAYL